MGGHKIIEALKEAVAGDIARVTIDGHTWARVSDIHADQQEIMRINNDLRALLLKAREHVPPGLLAQINAAVR